MILKCFHIIFTTLCSHFFADGVIRNEFSSKCMKQSLYISCAYVF